MNYRKRDGLTAGIEPTSSGSPGRPDRGSLPSPSAGESEARTPTATLGHPASLRASLFIRVQSFGRFDEILYLVEKAPDLTLPDSVRCHFPVAIERNNAHATD